MNGGTLKIDRARLQRAREMLGYGLEKTAEEAGVSKNSVLRAEHEEDIRPVTARKIAAALHVSVADLIGESETLKAQPPRPDLQDGRRAAWEATVKEAQRLRNPVRGRMWRARNEWRASEQRGEPETARRGYLAEMGNLLQEAYGAYTALGNAYIEAALTQGGSEASVPSYLREETEAANDFYVEMFGLVRNAGLTIHRGTEATAAAKRFAKVQSEARPHSVQEAG